MELGLAPTWGKETNKAHRWSDISLQAQPSSVICFTRSKATHLICHSKCSCASSCLSSLPITSPQEVPPSLSCSQPLPGTSLHRLSHSLTPNLPISQALTVLLYSHRSSANFFILFSAPRRATPSLCFVLQRPRAAQGGWKRLWHCSERTWSELGKAAEMLRSWLCMCGVPSRPRCFLWGSSGSAPHQRGTRQGWSEASSPEHQVYTRWHVTSKGALGCSYELLLPPGLHATLDLLLNFLSFCCSKPGPECCHSLFSLPSCISSSQHENGKIEKKKVSPRASHFRPVIEKSKYILYYFDWYWVKQALIFSFI